MIVVVCTNDFFSYLNKYLYNRNKTKITKDTLKINAIHELPIFTSNKKTIKRIIMATITNINIGGIDISAPIICSFHICSIRL